MNNIYEIGKQPCDNYDSVSDIYNIHSCMQKGSNGKYCEGTVSFCKNCAKDHHEEGYDTCVCNCWKIQ